MIRRLIHFGPLTTPSSSSFTNRAASSFPVSSLHIPSCRPILAGRGRVKPAGRASISARIHAARQSRGSASSNGEGGANGVKVVKGRNKRRSSVYASDAIPIIRSVPEGTIVEALHLGLTPSHLPLPIPLGVEHYYGSPGSPVNPVPTPAQWTSSLGPFDTAINTTSILQGDISAMVRANGEGFDSHRSTLNDHLHVVYALARPGRSHHLGQPTYNAEFFDSDLPSLTSTLNSAVNEAGTRNALAAETEWNDIVAKLSGQWPASKETEMPVSKEERCAVEDAVSDLTVLLEGLEVQEAAVSRARGSHHKMVAVVDEDGNEEWIRMDSTRRKRRKKINKHKYKKRRKAQRALRKKLGK